MRTFLPALGLLAALAWAPVVRAECPQPYPGEQLVVDLQALQLALRNLDEGVYADAGKRLEVGIVCLSSAAPPPIFASAYRYIGTYHYLIRKDEAVARRWFRTALEIDPTHTWDATELELEHPLRKLYDDERMAATSAPVPLEGKVVNLPAGSRLIIDGRSLELAGATLDRPHLVQQVGSDRAIRGTFLIEGNAIPAQFLREKDAPVVDDAPPPKKLKGRRAREAALLTQPSEGLQVNTVQRMRPAEKTPLMIGSALCILGAGGVYAGSHAIRGQFESADTTSELESTRALTNTLVIASGGVLLLGAGVGYWGIILEGGAGVGVAGSF